MDLVDRIETTRFLGSEFLAWLWFKIELCEGTFDVPGTGKVELWFDTQVVLASWTDETEKVMLRGAAPSSSPEAAEALRQGKIPFRATLRMTIGAEEYVLGLNARTFGLSGVKLPEVLLEEVEERFYERMRLLEQLDQVLSALYDEFLALRLASSWEGEALPMLRDWVKGKEGISPRSYAALLRRALSEREPGKRKRR